MCLWYLKSKIWCPMWTSMITEKKLEKLHGILRVKGNFLFKNTTLYLRFQKKFIALLSETKKKLMNHENSNYLICKFKIQSSYHQMFNFPVNNYSKRKCALNYKGLSSIYLHSPTPMHQDTFPDVFVRKKWQYSNESKSTLIYCGLPLHLQIHRGIEMAKWADSVNITGRMALRVTIVEPNLRYISWEVNSSKLTQSAE